MNTTHSPGRVFYGWWVVAASSGILMSFSGIAFYSFSNLIVPLEEAFGWSRGQLSVSQSLLLLAQGVTGIVAGRLVPRYGIRKLVFTGALLTAVSLLLLSHISALWHLYVLYCVVGLGTMLSGVVPIATVISNWFTTYRGRAMGLTMMGIAFGAITYSPLTGALVEAFDWRAAYIAMGLLAPAVNIPLSMVLRTTPQEMGLAPDGRTPAPTEVQAAGHRPAARSAGSMGEGVTTAITSARFWLIGVAFFLMGTGTIGVLQHQAPFIRDMGFDAQTAALALGITGGLGVVGKVGFGVLTEVIHVRYAALICFGLQAIGAFILLQTHTMAMVWVYAVVFGIGMGGNVTLAPLIVGNLFPMGIFATVFGLLNFSMATGGGIVGPPLAGFVRDATGSYDTPLTVFIIGYLIGLALTYLTWGPKPRVRAPVQARALSD